MRWCVPFGSEAMVGRLPPDLSCFLWEEEMVSPEDLLGSPTLRGPTGSVLPAPAQALSPPTGDDQWDPGQEAAGMAQGEATASCHLRSSPLGGEQQGLSPVRLSRRLLDLCGPSRFWMPALRWVSGSGPRLPLEGMGGTEEELAEP